MSKETVIIIGGGATGLMAAKRLARRYHIILLEATSRIGGRIWSKPLSNSNLIIEAGAEFIHGHQKQTLKLLKKAGIDYVPVEGRMYRKERGAWSEQTEMIEGWDALLKTMKRIKTDMTLHDFLHQYFGAEEYADLRTHATYYAEGFDLADTRKASVRTLFKEWSNEEENTFRIPTGYGALIEFLKKECERKGCRILTGHAVKQIDWKKNDVTVHTANDGAFHCSRLIVTVPINTLAAPGNKDTINFTTGLDEYLKAAHEIGNGSVIKTIFSFRQRFWPGDMGYVFCNEVFPTWWSQLPDKSPLLCGWCGGPKAMQLSNRSDDEILQTAIGSLSAIFNKSHQELWENLQEGHVFNWQSDTLNLYGYSYDTLNTKSARQLLNTPVDDTIYFAGEALYEGKSPGTVEAALVSGRNVAAKLM